MTPIQPTKRYRTSILDSDQWLDFEVRSDDIVVATPYKAGTTWTQNIVIHLIFQDLEPRRTDDVSPWLDVQRSNAAEVKAKLAAQTHRRVIKSHLPFDGLVFHPGLRYVVVGRDPRDIFMSMWNFYRNFGDGPFAPPDDPTIPALPRPPETILEFWDDWISTGRIEGESDGYPFWSVFHQAQSWWDQRHRDNVIFLHYADMLADLRSEIARLAAFLGITVADDMLDRITEACTFAKMKTAAIALDTEAGSGLKGGAGTFFHKGTNGRWREVLDDARLARYERVASARMDPGCKAWMETGGVPAPA